MIMLETAPTMSYWYGSSSKNFYFLKEEQRLASSLKIKNQSVAFCSKFLQKLEVPPIILLYYLL